MVDSGAKRRELECGRRDDGREETCDDDNAVKEIDRTRWVLIGFYFLGRLHPIARMNGGPTRYTKSYFGSICIYMLALCTRHRHRPSPKAGESCFRNNVFPRGVGGRQF